MICGGKGRGREEKEGGKREGGGKEGEREGEGGEGREDVPIIDMPNDTRGSKAQITQGLVYIPR